MSRKKRQHAETAAAPSQKSVPQTELMVRLLGPALLILVLIATALTYSSVFDQAKEFTNWDDPAYVTEQPLVRSLDAETIRTLFKTETRIAANYHPLTMLTLAWDYERGKGAIAPFMQTTLMLHLINTALVFMLIGMLFRGNLVLSVLCTAFFGLHPMHVESVAWVAERKDVLYSAFFLLSLITYIRYMRGGSWLWLTAAFASFVASCYAKPMAVTLPVVLVLFDVYEKRSFSIRTVLEKVPFFIVSLIFGLLTLEVQSSISVGLVDTTYYTLPERILFAGYGITQYIVKLFVPGPMSAFYPYPEQNGDPESVVYLLAAVAAALIGLTLWFYVRRRSELTERIFFGMAFFLVTVSIVLQFISVGGAIIADRYTYVPYIGLFVAVGALLQHATKSLKAPFTALGIIAVASVAYGYTAAHRVDVWRDSGLLWEDVIAQYGSRPIYHAYNNRAVFYLGKGDLARAERDYVLLERAGTEKSYTYKGYGQLLMSQKRIPEAVVRLTKALRYGGPDAQVLYARGACYSELGKRDSAIADFIEARKITPNDYRLAMYLLEELLRANKYSEIVQQGQAMSTLLSDNIAYNLLMGVTYGELGQHAKAYASFARALELDPTNEPAKMNMEIAKKSMR